MAPRLLILSCNIRLVAEIRSRLAGRFDFVIADSLQACRARAESSPIRAVLVHLCGETLNGETGDGFAEKLGRVAESLPVYGLAGRDCPASLREQITARIQGCLLVPEELDQLERLLEIPQWESNPEDADFAMPHRVLIGRTRSLITFSPAMFEIFDRLKVAAAHDVTVLLVGETGCGKSYIGRLIHELSPRNGGRCLTANCGALPSDLLACELFGHVQGAFLGADCDRTGKLAAADQGTLLLEEIETLSAEMQAKLLRFIETGEYEPVGTNETRTSRARLVATSDADLEELVHAGRFRVDLYYRLNSICFQLPPLRERPWDIDYLARQFAVEHSRAHRIPLPRIAQEYLAALRRYTWPGNVRELENVVQWSVLYSAGGVLRATDLPSTIRPGEHTGGNGHTSANGKPPTLEQRVDEVERRIIEESLRRHNECRTDTARELGISRVTLYNKMKKYGMLQR